jgi:hypothetical protein
MKQAGREDNAGQWYRSIQGRTAEDMLYFPLIIAAALVGAE